VNANSVTLNIHHSYNPVTSSILDKKFKGKQRLTVKKIVGVPNVFEGQTAARPYISSLLY